MESTALFQPPPPYKDDLDVTYTHGVPSISYFTPHTDPLCTYISSEASLTDQRRQHVRRLYDLLQLMLLRQDLERASRCLHMLLMCQEWRPIELWKLGLQVAWLSDDEQVALHYTQRIMRSRTNVRPYALVFLVRELIKDGQYQRAHEELTSVIASFPYRHHPQLHTYLGLLTLFLGTSTSSPGTQEASVSILAPTLAVSSVPFSVQKAARLHFENAIKVAPRYLHLQSAVVRHRLRQHEKRLSSLRGKAVRHTNRMWNAMKEAGWIFRNDESVPSATRPAPSQETDQDSDSSSPARIMPSSPTLPHTDFFGLDSHFTSSSESESDTDASLGTPMATTASEGPSLPPSTAPSRDVTPQPTEDEDVERDTIALSSTELSDQKELHFPIPAVSWAVHISTLYLEVVRCVHAITY